MRFRWLLLMIIGIALGTHSLAFAQGGAAGSITGTVTDQSGNPLRGVQITAESDALASTGKVATSNEEGTFHFLGLPPGTYKLTATAPGMNATEVESLKVGITSDTEANLIMEAKTEEETITIVDAPSIVSTSRAAVKETYDLRLVENIPFNDPINQFRDIIDMTPGTINRRVRGGGQRQTLFTQDGFEIKEQFPSLRSSAAFETQTAAYGADAPTASGGVSNLVTRSGTNKFKFEFTAVADAAFTRFFRDKGEPSTGQKRFVINPTISGPIVKDHLWYHLNLETYVVQEPNPRDPLLVLPETDPFFNPIQKVTAKTRWQIDSRNKLELLLNGDWPYQRNNRRDPGISNEAQADRLAQRYFAGLSWETLLSDALLFRSQVGYIGFYQNIYPRACRNDPDHCYDAPNIRQRLPTALEFGNAPKHDKQALQSVQFINTLEYFLSTEHFGDHNLRLKDTVYIERDKQQTAETGNQLLEFAGTLQTNVTTFYSNDPRLEPPQYGFFTGTVNSIKHVLTLSDTWKINKNLTALPALSFVQAKATNNKGTFPYSDTTWAPAISLVYDINGDGKTVLRTSGSVYVDIDLSNVGRFAVGTQVSNRCGYNPPTNTYDYQCVYSGGLTNKVSPNLTTPRTWEATLGGQREIAPGTAIGLDAIYRLFTHQFEDFETNRIWNASGTDVIGYRNGSPETVLELRTPSEAYRRYFGTTLSLVKSEGALRVNASYTLGWLYGTVLDGFANYYGTIAPQDQFLYGPLADDHRHEIKLTGYYQFSPWLMMGIRYIYYSGTPTNHLFYNPVTNTYNSYRSQTGTDPGANLNDPADDRTLRLPDVQSLNIQLRALLQPLIGYNASVFVEVLNVLGLRTPLTQGVGDQRDFGLVLTRVDPFRIRLGVDFRTD